MTENSTRDTSEEEEERLRTARWLMVSVITLGVACSSDIEEWDYRAAIRKDLKERTNKLECPPGKHMDRQCPNGKPGNDCPETCVPNAR